MGVRGPKGRDARASGEVVRWASRVKIEYRLLRALKARTVLQRLESWKLSPTVYPLARHNENPKPFIWTAKPPAILEKVRVEASHSLVISDMQRLKESGEAYREALQIGPRWRKRFGTREN